MIYYLEMGTYKYLNLDELAIMADHDPEFQAIILEKYLQSLDDWKDQLQAAHDSGDTYKVNRAIHKYKPHFHIILPDGLRDKLLEIHERTTEDEVQKADLEEVRRTIALIPEIKKELQTAIDGR